MLVALVLAGCAGRIPEPTQADALRAATRWPGTTVESLAHGRALYVERCSGCHALHLPHEKPADAWPALVHKMAPRSKIDAPTEQEIARYLTITASAP